MAEDEKSPCGAIIYMQDNFGSVCGCIYYSCELIKGHKGFHAKSGKEAENKFTLYWVDKYRSTVELPPVPAVSEGI